MHHASHSTSHSLWSAFLTRVQLQRDQPCAQHPQGDWPSEQVNQFGASVSLRNTAHRRPSQQRVSGLTLSSSRGCWNSFTYRLLPTFFSRVSLPHLTCGVDVRLRGIVFAFMLGHGGCVHRAVEVLALRPLVWVPVWAVYVSLRRYTHPWHEVVLFVLLLSYSPLPASKLTVPTSGM